MPKSRAHSLFAGFAFYGCVSWGSLFVAGCLSGDGDPVNDATGSTRAAVMEFVWGDDATPPADAASEQPAADTEPSPASPNAGPPEPPAGPPVFAVVMAEAEQAKPAAAPALLPTSGSEPAFRPDVWNGRVGRPGNNCYAYACDDFDGRRRSYYDFPQPGQTAGWGPPRADEFLRDPIRRRAAADGLRPVPPGSEDQPAPRGFYKVALFLAPGQDYHWYRQNPDGFWSHKLADDPVEATDARGDPIADPRTADRNYVGRTRPYPGPHIVYNYSEFGGFFYVPEGGLRLTPARR